jgi:hypothetical protein
MRYRLKAIEVNTDMGRTVASIITATGERFEFPVPIDSSLEFDFGANGVLLETETTSLSFLTEERE